MKKVKGQIYNILKLRLKDINVSHRKYILKWTKMNKSTNDMHGITIMQHCMNGQVFSV